MKINVVERGRFSRATSQAYHPIRAEPKNQEKRRSDEESESEMVAEWKRKKKKRERERDRKSTYPAQKTRKKEEQGRRNQGKAFQGNPVLVFPYCTKRLAPTGRFGGVEITMMGMMGVMPRGPTALRMPGEKDHPTHG